MGAMERGFKFVHCRGILCALLSHPGPFMAARTARIERNTRETQIRVEINLDGTGEARLASGIPFLDHMLDPLPRHGLIDRVAEDKGARDIDEPHTVEDISITRRPAFDKEV